MSLREIRGIRVEEVDLSKPVLNRARRSLPRKDYLAMQNLKRPKPETTAEKQTANDKNNSNVSTDQSLRKSKRVRRQSVLLANSEVKLELKLDPRHSKRVEFDRRFPCSYCGITLPSLGSLNEHRLIHTEIKISKAKLQTAKESLKCHKCYKKFKKLKSLKKHLYNIHRKQDFKCEMCNRHFNCKHTLLIHWQGKICNYFDLND